MNIAVCDDEFEFLQIITAEIKGFFSNYHIDYHLYLFKSGNDFIRSSEKFDIILMDIDLGLMNGMELINSYRKNHRSITIFLTSHNEEMANGYKVNAFRFLVKPLNKDDFYEAMNQALLKLESTKSFLAKDNGTEIRVDADDIIYVEAGDKSSCIRTETGFFSIGNTISQMSRELQSLDFYMPHRSYIVNLNYIEKIYDHKIQFSNGELIKISRLKYNDFREKYYDFIRRKSQYVN